MLKISKVSLYRPKRTSIYRLHSHLSDGIIQNNDDDSILSVIKDTLDQEEPALIPVLKKRLDRNSIPKYHSLKEISDIPKNTVPQLAHGLERTLFSPGVHYSVDPRTKIINFDSSLLKIPHIDKLKIDKISSFTPSSRDKKLEKISRKLNKENPGAVKFYSSTSSMTGLLMKLHQLCSNGRQVNTSNFSHVFPSTSNFSTFSKVPTSVVVTPKDLEHGTYSVDADRSMDTEITLSVLGHALELILTKSPEEFQKYLKDSKEQPKEDPSAYHYAKIGKFLVRSQLDSYSSNLPGEGTFDIKTRAVCAIRFDMYHTNYYPTNYEITKLKGLFESFERELFDAARIVMFKYSLQARLGNMDGIFVAYHNMKKLLGFQYLPLGEIDNYFFGEPDSINTYGNRIFQRPQKEGESDITDEVKEQMNVLNSELMNKIANDFGNHWQSKRELLSSKIADHELCVSVDILDELLEKIVCKTKGKPFRMIFSTGYTKADNINESSVEISDESEESDEYLDKQNKTTKKVELTVVVSTLTEAQLEEMQMLSDERFKKEYETVCDLQDGNNQQQRIKSKKMTTLGKIKYLANRRATARKNYFALNDSIFESSSMNNGLFVYKITANHFINNELCLNEHPLPSVDWLNAKNDYNWETEYEIHEVVSTEQKVNYFNRVIKKMARNNFRTDVSRNNVYSSDGIKLDSAATEMQNIMRAYSLKALKREESYKELMNLKIKNKKNFQNQDTAKAFKNQKVSRNIEKKNS